MAYLCFIYIKEQNKVLKCDNSTVDKKYSQIDAGIHVLYDFLVTVKAAPHECVIRTSQPQT